jgi:hypothetical protein
MLRRHEAEGEAAQDSGGATMVEIAAAGVMVIIFNVASPVQSAARSRTTRKRVERV